MNPLLYLLIILIFLPNSCAKKGIPLEGEDVKENKDTYYAVEEIMYVNSAEGLNVRNYPSIDSDRLFVLNNYEKVLVLQKGTNDYKIDDVNGNWFLVRTNEITGWVFSGYLVTIEGLNSEIGENGEIELISENTNRFGGKYIEAKIVKYANVHLLPNYGSRVIEMLSYKDKPVQIIGFSEKKETMPNNIYWIKIYYGEGKGSGDPKMGWIAIEIDNMRKWDVSNLEIERSELNKWGNVVLIGKYSLGEEIVKFSVLPSKVESQNFLTFGWDYTNKDFHYSNKPGTYIWDDVKEELQHISYIGGEGSKWGFSSWQIVTDDFKYLLQDQGTAPPPRVVVVWNLEDGEEIFSLSYYNNINLKNNKIEIVKRYGYFDDGRWALSNHINSAEINFGNNYIKENKPSDEMITALYGFSLLLKIEFNIDTKDSKIIDGFYNKNM